MRSAEHIEERKEACRLWQKRPASYWTDQVDMILDNTTWDVPATVRAKSYLKKCKVRGHLRTRGEGLQPHYTKPCTKKHKLNTGPKLKIVCGLVNCRVAVWHYLKGGTWNGAVAARVYRGPIRKALVRHRGEKRTYVVLEDNDPSGYKSNSAKQAKKDVSIVALAFPRYSPDLSPLDYFFWQEVEARMAKGEPSVLETTDAFKARLRRTARGVPECVIRKGVADMKARLVDCYSNGGKLESWD